MDASQLPFTFRTHVHIAVDRKPLKILEFDEGRCHDVAILVAKMWHEKQGVFKDMRPPEVRFRPDTILDGSREHACYLFALALASRSGSTAEGALGALGKLTRERPGIIDPNVPWQNDYGELIGRALPFGTSDAERVEDFRRARQLVAEKYGGDPRNIFLSEVGKLKRLPHIKDQRRELIKCWTQFRGIGSKIAQLAIHWFQEATWPGNKDEWNHIRQIPVIAVDIWWCRQALQLGLISHISDDTREFLEPRISEYFSLLCYEWGISWNDLAQGIWHNGAENCGLIPSNKVSLWENRGRCHACPVTSYCGGRIPFLGGSRLVKVGKRKAIPQGEDSAFRRHTGLTTINGRRFVRQLMTRPFNTFHITQHVTVSSEKYAQICAIFPNLQPVVIDYDDLERLRGILPVYQLPDKRREEKFVTGDLFV